MRTDPGAFPGGLADLEADCRVSFTPVESFDDWYATEVAKGGSRINQIFWEDSKSCGISSGFKSVTNCADGEVKDGDWCQSCCYQNCQCPPAFVYTVRHLDKCLTPSQHHNIARLAVIAQSSTRAWARWANSRLLARI